jgi:hypothetical protein
MDSSNRLLAPLPQTTANLLLTLILSGCESEDQRFTSYVAEVQAQQTRQHERLVEQIDTVLRQNEHLTQAAQKLVEQDARARQELVRAQSAGQARFDESAAALDRQREQLARERQRAIESAMREPLLAEAISGAALTVAALLPLVLALYAVTRLPDHNEAETWLVTELGEGGLLFPWIHSGPSSCLPRPRSPLAELPAKAASSDGGDALEGRSS